MAVVLNQKDLEHKLSTLTEEHVELDNMIDKTEKAANFDQLMLQRFKKRRLLIRDQIDILKHMKEDSMPDSIA